MGGLVCAGWRHPGMSRAALRDCTACQQVHASDEQARGTSSNCGTRRSPAWPAWCRQTPDEPGDEVLYLLFARTTGGIDDVVAASGVQALREQLDETSSFELVGDVLRLRQRYAKPVHRPL